MFTNHLKVAFITHQLIFLTSVTIQAAHVEDQGVTRDSSNFFSKHLFFQNESRSTTFITTESDVISTPMPNPNDPWPYDISMGKIITLLLVSFSIPVIFMALLLWRLQKEKKYLNSGAGALVYRETVLVPSYAISNTADTTTNTTANFNVVQMHSTLYDTPPNYDDVLNPSVNRTTGGTERDENEREVQINKSSKIDEIPPPAYSTVYM